MNKVILIGRLVADPEVIWSQGENASCVARYRLAVDRRFKREGEQTADFISCMKQDKYDGINCAIFEADGGAWKITAANAIKEYLQSELADFPQFTVIS